MVLVINIKISATCFGFFEPSSGQIHNIVPVHSVSVYGLTECASTMFCIWPDDGSMSQNMSPNF